jgi:hypothetical protein
MSLPASLLCVKLQIDVLRDEVNLTKRPVLLRLIAVSSQPSAEKLPAYIAAADYRFIHCSCVPLSSCATFPRFKMLGCGQGDIKVCLDIVDMLKADGEPDIVKGRTCCFLFCRRELGMRRGGRVDGQAFGITDIG